MRSSSSSAAGSPAPAASASASEPSRASARDGSGRRRMSVIGGEHLTRAGPDHVGWSERSRRTAVTHGLEAPGVRLEWHDRWAWLVVAAIAAVFVVGSCLVTR